MRTISSSSIEGQVCQVAEADAGRGWAEVDCFEPGDELLVEQTYPEHRRENVDYDRPPLVMRFNEAVRAADLEEQFSLYTFSRSGNRMNVQGRLRAQSATRFEFQPVKPLRPGVIYEARIAGGEHGLKSRDGAGLVSDHRWRFSTIVNLDEQSAAENASIDPNVFQTARNAPLVPGKPAMTRLTVDWQTHNDVDLAWQVTSFPAIVQISHPHGRIIDHTGRDRASGEMVRLMRSDQFDDEARRQARNTINFFGWFPPRSGASVTVSASVEPHDPYPGPRAIPIRFHGDREVPMWPYEPHLRFHYARVLIGDWEDGVPADDAAALRRGVQAAEIFSTQTFPVVSTRGLHTIEDVPVRLADRWGGRGKFDERGAELIVDPLRLAGYYSRVLGRIVKYVHDRMAGHLAPSDILAVMHPLVVSARGDLAGGQAVSGVHDLHPMDEAESGYHRRAVRIPVSREIPAAVLSHALVHEFGHTFGLHHHPANLSDIDIARLIAPGRFSGIEGFRIAPSGFTSWNKSVEEGNAEHQRNLAPLMWPAARPDGEMFIRNSSYAQVQRVIENEATFWGFRQKPERWFASVAADASRDGAGLEPGWDLLPDQRMALTHVQAGMASPTQAERDVRDTRYLIVIGSLRQDGSEAWIESVHQAPRALAAQDGPFVAELHDASGRVLRSVAFAVEPERQPVAQFAAVQDMLGQDDPLMWPYFSVSLPYDPRAQRLVIRSREQVLIERERADTPPEARLDIPARLMLEEPTTIHWHVIAGAPTRFDLLYSPNGAAPWQMLRLDTEATAARIEPGRLRPGLAPTLRLIARDGFDEFTHEVPVEVSRSPGVVLLLQENNEALDPGQPLELAFDVEMNSDSVREGLRLVRSEDGKEVPFRIMMDPTGHTAALLPEERLDPETAYIIVLSAGIEDAFGNLLDPSKRLDFLTSDAREQDWKSFFEKLPDPANAPSDGALSTTEASTPGVIAELYLDGRHETGFLVLACQPDTASPFVPVLHAREINDAANPGEIFVRRLAGPEGLIEEVELRGEFDKLRSRHLARDGAWFNEHGQPAGPIVSSQGGLVVIETRIILPESGTSHDLRLEAECP